MVDRIVKESRIAGLTVDAVELFGSNASYEYDDTSDFGIHVFVRSSELNPEQLGDVLRLLNDYVERRQEGRITFNGVVVEVTFHSERTENYRPSPGIGQYSVSQARGGSMCDWCTAIRISVRVNLDFGRKLQEGRPHSVSR